MREGRVRERSGREMDESGRGACHMEWKQLKRRRRSECWKVRLHESI